MTLFDLDYRRSKRRVFCLIIIAALISAGIHSSIEADAKQSLRQSCVGTVGLGEDGLQLLDIPKSSSSWCDASFDFDKSSSLAKQVLATCPIKSRCNVEGLYAGHGMFYWTKIISIRKMPGT
ncbi:hypothetical protein FNL56_21585 [Tardiphaga sp. vice304]|uniref:hypothetical protein n=1 Tax=Tardiphaga sp. vice304 TaxID=2592817 RepID=UPI00116343E0|nr:hypothetical protein [Tardiphaga sp. vice304]QDM28416.1 hypothetical protein FNL56_21585 [Tardiphaga sp. vice304]